jgi:hypothetical protein
MRRLLIAGLLVAVFMAVTNPGMDQFREHLVQGAATSEAATTLGRLVDRVARQVSSEVLLAGAKRTDLLVASLYRTEINGQEYVWLGVFKQFIQVAGPAR